MYISYNIYFYTIWLIKVFTIDMRHNRISLKEKQTNKNANIMPKKVFE